MPTPDGLSLSPLFSSAGYPVFTALRPGGLGRNRSTNGAVSSPFSFSSASNSRFASTPLEVDPFLSSTDTPCSPLSLSLSPSSPLCSGSVVRLPFSTQSVAIRPRVANSFFPFLPSQQPWRCQRLGSSPRGCRKFWTHRSGHPRRGEDALGTREPGRDLRPRLLGRVRDRGKVVLPRRRPLLGGGGSSLVSRLLRGWSDGGRMEEEGRGKGEGWEGRVKRDALVIIPSSDSFQLADRQPRVVLPSTDHDRGWSSPNHARQAREP